MISENKENTFKIDNTDGKEITSNDEFEIISKRKYKQINKKRILDLSIIGIDIDLLGVDEIFVKLMDYKDAWLSNYGRVITLTNNKYKMLKYSYDDDGSLKYKLQRNVFYKGKWIFRRVDLYAEKAVVEEFIVNDDKKNNIFIWHKGYDKQDYYYQNLYPLNQAQYEVVEKNFNEYGDDSEDFILKVMNDIRYKPDKWNKKQMMPVVCGLGYHGFMYTGSLEESYQRWKNMIFRCYSETIHKSYPEYKDCTVCEEWLNYSNFKMWYNTHIEPWELMGLKVDLDKDILFKGNKVYSPETVSFVPHIINTLFVNGKNNRGDLPLGVYYDPETKKYCACMSLMRKRKKLGRFDTSEAAFTKYKQYKEDFIKHMAEQYKEKLPDKVYQAMMKWEIEIDD